jgi:hypothetical protein
MGREIRMVPPNWNHPVVDLHHGEGFQPMFDETFAEAMKEWKEGFAEWESGKRPSYFINDEDSKDMEYHEYSGGPPNRKYYRPWKDEEATWYQVWETVSEGTPVTPPFATKEELIEYLVANGDFWDQERRKRRSERYPVAMNCDPWPRQQAEAFVNGPGWAPSAVITSAGMMSGVEAVAVQIKSKSE